VLDGIGLDQQKAVAAVPRADLIHPGVARYLRESGLLRRP
jgi:hypothetical protein